MNTKIVGIIIGLMLTTTCFTVAQTIQRPITNTTQKQPKTTQFDVNAPEWTIGNTWSYRIDTFRIDYEEPNVTTTLHAIIDTQDITLTVIDDTGDTYITSLNAALEGQATFYMMSSEGPINITVEFEQIDLTGTIVFNKTDIAIRQINLLLSGKFNIKINQQPFLDIPLPAISASATINSRLTSTTPYTIIQFPFDVNDTWGLPATNITVDGTIQSPWLNLTYRINNFIQKWWPIIEPILQLLGIDPTMIKALSDFLTDPEILPIMDIGTILTLLVGSNVFEFPEMESLFHVNNTEYITIPPGTFFVYNITIADGVGYLLYAPDAGTIIKIVGRFSDIIPFVTDLNVVLIDISYP